MVECFFCENDDAVFGAVANGEIVNICQECSLKENIPIVKRPTSFQLIEAERRYPTFKERAEQRRKKIETENSKRWNIDKQKVNLRDIINKNYKPTISAKENPDLGLIDNFHWIIMRARRKRHLTHKQVAEAIQESEATVEMLEKGQLPQDYPKLINKIEHFFGINITDKKGIKMQERKLVRESPRMLNFDANIAQNLTISDLQKIKKQKEEAGKKEVIEDLGRKMREEQEEFEEEEYFD